MSITYPTTKLEGWRYTSLKALEQANLAPISGDFHSPNLSKHRRPQLKTSVQLTAYNGFWQPWNDLPQGVTVLPLSAALQRWPQQAPQTQNSPAHTLQQLTQADISNGLYIEIAPQAIVKQPIELFYAHDCTGATHLPVVINIGERAQVNFIETTTGDSSATAWHNRTQHWHVGANAQVKFAAAQQQNSSSFQTVAHHILLENNANFESLATQSGANISRQEFHVKNSNNSYFKNNSVQLTGTNQHHDTHLHITHTGTGAQSHTQVRNICASHGHGVFLGKYQIEPNAQQTNAQMLCKSLLLSQKAVVSVKPELEIHADDVSCSHGATSGQLDEEALFYMQSRGLDNAAAKRFLLQAFAHEIIEQHADFNNEITQYFHQIIDEKLTELAA